MTDRPIIFSAPMIRALLAGRKTQTRRLASSPLRRVEAGDRLYVREAHAIVPATAYGMSDGVEQIGNPADQHQAAIYAVGWERSKPTWRPSIHMPRWASRLTLIVEQVRFQRLQEISEIDAIREGVTLVEDYLDHPITAFQALWDSLHGARGETWCDDPEIVALTFRVVHSNIDRIAA